MTELTKPTGGWNVILSMIDVLNAAGMPARPVYPSADYRYPFFDCGARPLFDSRLGRAFRGSGLRNWFPSPRKLLPSPAVNEPLALQAEDVLANPEFRFPEIAALYPSHRKVCVVQAFASFVAMLRRLEERGAVVEDCSCVATSIACAEAVGEFLGREPGEIVLRVATPDTVFVARKALKIAYMPRRLPRQVQAVVGALEASPEARGVEIVSLDGLTHQEVMVELQDSLIFLSFSSADGFGLPPAEAMAAGCIVVGYDGVGGAEFFTREVGFPIAADDMMTFVRTVRTVRDVLRQYKHDPGPLDDLRRRASDMILSRYSEARFRDSVLRVFSQLDRERVPS